MNRIFFVLMTIALAGCWQAATGEIGSDDLDTQSEPISDVDADADSDTDSDTDSDSDTESDSDTDGDTDIDTGTETTLDSDVVDSDCPSGHSTACYGGNVWCVDAALAPVSLQQECLAAEHCENGPPATCECTPVITSQCYEGDVWQYDSCIGIDVRLDTCATCETCQNTSETTAACTTTTVQAYQQCGADGNVYWFDSCGIIGAVADDCSDLQCNTGCENTTDTTARCLKKDNYTPCTLMTTPDRSYDICINGVCQSPGCGTADCNAPGPHFPLPDTNQRDCYDGDSTMTCASSGQAYFGQDAQYGWDVTHAATERYTRNLEVSGEPTVTDNVTTLMWQGCTAGLTGDVCGTSIWMGTSFTWEESLAYCDGLSWGGYSDWRLPDRYELDSIVDGGLDDSPTIDVSAFPHTAPSNYWSSSCAAFDESDAWSVDFDFGWSVFGSKNGNRYVRCVRGEPTPHPFNRYTRIGDMVAGPLVTDNVTGLMWQGCAGGLSGDACDTGTAASYTWEKSLAYCESLSWGGYSDWRLPDLRELNSITDTTLEDPLVDVTAFPGIPSPSNFWSSSSGAIIGTMAWLAFFDYNTMSFTWKSSPFHVRCVRGGLWVEP